MSKRLKIIISLGVLCIIVAGIGYKLGYQAVYGANTINNQDYHIFWTEAVSLDSVTLQLVNDEVLKNKKSFKLLAKQKGFVKAKPGHYVIKKGENNNTLINRFMAGLQTPVNVTFTAKPNIQSLCGHVSKQLRLDSALLFDYLNTSFLELNNIEKAHLPAYFLPNTYQFFWTISEAGFSERMFDEYERFWNVERFSQAQSKGLTPMEVTTLASIVDGETHKVDEMPKVAGLYINRLNIGMKLQSDPTVRYAIKQEKGFDYEIRRVLFKDLKIASKYNTYYTVGLPPGPISIASIQAINAVLNAQETNNLYMCANPKTGYHDFTSSYREHQQNARKYQQWLQQKRIYR